MANELDAVEKLLVSNHGWTDNGDGTLTNKSGLLYDRQVEGGYFTREEETAVNETVVDEPAANETVVDAGTEVDETAGSEVVLNKYGIAIPNRADYGSMDSYMLAVSDVQRQTRKAAAKASQEQSALVSQLSATKTTSDVRPNVGEFMDATGASRSEANEIIYGTIGANTDTRDWAAIMASEDPVEAAIQGNFEQYSSGAATSNTDTSKYATFENPDGTKAGIVETDTGFALVASDGTPLRVGLNSLEKALDQGKYFGITDFLGKAEETPVEEEVVEEVLPVEEEVVEEVLPVEEEVVEEVIPTEVIQLEQGEVAAINPVPQTVVQQVTPPTYYDEPQQVTSTNETQQVASTNETQRSIIDPLPRTFSKSLQTAGLSAVPQQVTYKTHYAGTPGLVDPTLYAPIGGGTGVQQVVYRNKLGQEMIVTEINRQPVTYVPPGFIRIGTYAEIAQKQQQQFTGNAQQQQQQATGNAQQQQQKSTGMALGSTLSGYASGGDVALIKLAKMNGFKGDDVATARSFMNASEGLRKKVQAMGTLMNRGGLAMAQGGSVPNQAMIAGQPHRLAYVNPQEEAMMKAAGGAGAPSYGGIPAYFTIMADPNNPPEVGSVTTDPTTGTKYTWNGTSYDITSSSGESLGSTGGIGSTGGGTDTSSDQVPFDQLPFPVQQAYRDQNLVAQTMQPIQAPVSYMQPQAADFIPVDAGQSTPIAPYAEAATVGTVQQANQQVTPTADDYDFTPAYAKVGVETAALTAEQGTVSKQAQVTEQQQTTSAVTGMQGAQDVSTDVVAPAPRDMKTGELIDPVANAASAAAFTKQVQAATATPSAKATVAGQLEGLMQQFEGGNTPAWAAGSMRTAMATLAARGLGASSLAGQAVIQATMEAALPIAQMDAQVQAQFESQNLSNRQQRAMLSAQQRATFLGMEFDQAFQARVQNSARIGDIANMNFSAEQNIALENARAANTMNLNNLSNRQAMVMAEAAALSNLDMANLNNRQQAAVQNAQSFLQMDMTNLANDQQTAIFKSQQNIQALFTDQAAENAAEQFNATSQNQTDQYFANLRSQTSQFNASQQNAMDQFNINSVNALREFNSEIQQQRDMFNAQNGLLIAQSNAQWRQTVSTANQAAQNESNMNFAKTMNALSATNLDAYWQRERDVMSFAYASGESAADRVATILQTQLEAELKAEYQDAQGKGGLFATLIKGGLNYLGLASGGKNLILPGAS